MTPEAAFEILRAIADEGGLDRDARHIAKLKYRVALYPALYAALKDAHEVNSLYKELIEVVNGQRPPVEEERIKRAFYAIYRLQTAWYQARAQKGGTNFI